MPHQAGRYLANRSGWKAVQLPPGAADRLKQAIGSLPAHADVAPALHRLKAAGFTQVTLTNSGSAAQRTQLAAAGLADLFDRQFSVETAGGFKPDPRTYRMVADAYGVDTGDLMMVACHVWDTLGAKLAGCTAAFIARPGNAEMALPDIAPADIVADGFAALASALIV